VDFDSAAIGNNAIVGPALIQMAEQTNSQPSTMTRLGYAIRDASDYPGGLAQVKEDIGYSRYWGAIIATENSTSAWRSALENGNADYDPSGCVAVLYSGARFYQYTVVYLATFMQEAARMATQQAGAQAVGNYLQTINSNAALLANAAAVPQAIGTPFGYWADDVRPMQTQYPDGSRNDGPWAAAAPFEAALIYYLIWCFILALWHNAARMQTQFNKKTTFWSLYAWRLAVPFVMYFWLSLWFTILIVCWQIPVTAAVGRAGFVVLWALNYVALLAVGLAIETMLSVLTPKFLPFFLIFWIITNISSSFTPIETTQQFYRFLRWVPFLQIVEAYKIIFYATRENKYLGLYFGVLIAVTLVNLVGLALGMMLERKREEKALRKQVEESEKNEK